ncbi:diguanylate cyclase (GGDEF)-like protein [Motilibacter rhizosphaerae]|uniref:Diguanylate cyclase (GGDEF)-like protein n=1 Tax=Motilibacter rhizosphaerae TaxID=598652 RepID=A0A4V2F2S5_9ACTN|nr:EAL domain-containing protein [Motilibacter rhizosphaerae]RZS79476.1 diguanylate cyclase (GGDEF)-like protein [Motilibacter rhizosphaerae]
MAAHDGQALDPARDPESTALGGPRVPEEYRAVGLLYVCGGVLALVWLALPDRTAHGRPVVAAMACVAVVGGVVLVALSDLRRRAAPLHAVIALIQLVIAVAYVAARDPSNDLRWFWVWATPFTAFFFSRRHAAEHAAWVGAVLAASLAAVHPPLGTAVSLWAMTMGTVAAATTLVAWAAGRMRTSELRLQDLATRDPLTGLANRRVYATHTAAALRERDRHGGTVAVALIDLDDFKLVNDTYGHDTGDELLALTAARLSTATADTGATVVRLGGDEFAVVVRTSGQVDPSDLVTRISGIWEQPFGTGDGELWSSGSIGLALADERGADPTTLLREADAAMYQAKAPGGHGHAVYDEQMRHAAHSRLRLDSALRDGVARRQFHLHYQPVLDLRTGTWHGAEALLRWRHPQLGPVPPGTFIPLAEETRLIVPLGARVLDEAARQLAEWQAEGTVPPPFVLAVNVSSRQLRAGFVDSVAAALDQHGVPGSSLALELTESVLLADSPGIGHTLADLRALGVQLHLDDFGTGYSSLSYLERLPMDVLKIDRSFVADLTTSTEKRALVTAITAMADALGIPVTAEGVETPEQLALLRELGCRYGQGYLFARPDDPRTTGGLLRATPAYADGAVPEAR